MPASWIRDASGANASAVCADKGFFAKPETYDQIYAYAWEMDWMEKPFHFVVGRWLDRLNAVAGANGKKIWINQGQALACH